MKFRQLISHLDLAHSITDQSENGRSQGDTRKVGDLVERLQVLNRESLAYSTQHMGCYSRLFPLEPPKWTDVETVIDMGVSICGQKYGGLGEDSEQH